jgi:tetratricopeptide (TPR) repeat protein
MSLMNSYRFDEAIKQFDAAVMLKPENEYFRMFLNVARARQQIPGRLPDIKALADSDPTNVKARVDLIRQLAFIGRVDEAEVYVKQIYDLDPSDPSIFVHIGVAYSEARKSDKAIVAFKKALEKGQDGGAYLNLAMVSARAGNADAASTAFEKVIELKPDAAGIMHGYANHLLKNGKRREALEMYKRSLAITPNNAAVVFEVGLLSLKLGERDAAVVYLERLKVLDPRSAAILSRCITLKIWG